MKNFRQVLSITSDAPEQFFNLSYEVEECVRRSLISDGICVVMTQHTTSAVFLENNRDELFADWYSFADRLAPTDKTEYTVDYAPAGSKHLKAIAFGLSVTIPVSDGRLDLGPRQFIMYGDFDGCREKTVVVKIIGE